MELGPIATDSCLTLSKNKQKKLQVALNLQKRYLESLLLHEMLHVTEYLEMEICKHFLQWKSLKLTDRNFCSCKI